MTISLLTISFLNNDLIIKKVSAYEGNKITDNTNNLINEQKESDNNLLKVSTKSNLTGSMIENKKNEITNILINVFNFLFPEVSEKYINTDVGFEITFPTGWKGIESKIAISMATISPSGFNMTHMLLPTINQIIETYPNKNWEDLSQEEQNKLVKGFVANTLEYFSNLNSTMSIIIYNKEFLQMINSLPQNTTMPTDSLTSIYDYLNNQANANSYVNCSRTSLDRITIKDNIPAEVSTEMCSYSLYKNTETNSKNYLILTSTALISISYESNLPEENDFLSQFENAVKTISVKNSLPINEQDITQFLKN